MAPKIRPTSPTVLTQYAFGRRGRGRPRVPETDEQIGRHAHVGPADQHAQKTVGQHQQAHGEDEVVELREKPG